jgi:hypothetical protein
VKAVTALCPGCHKPRRPHPELGLSYLGEGAAGGFALCACGALARDGRLVGHIAVAHSRPGPSMLYAAVMTRPARRFRYLGYGHFRLEKVTP